MATIKLGRLEEVDVRKLWSHEQYDFSNWLAKEENIELLNEALGLTLVDIEKEVYVGSYRCGLVASDETTGQKIIIENQLEQSNHDHLGKVITYASGLDAKVIVWIVKDAREEHRSAVEWLNNNTNNRCLHDRSLQASEDCQVTYLHFHLSHSCREWNSGCR